MCLVTDSVNYCHSWDSAPVKFTSLAIVVILLAVVFFLLPFFPGARKVVREAVEETAEETGNEDYAANLLKHSRVSLAPSLVVFLAALALAVVLLLQRWGVL